MERTKLRMLAYLFAYWMVSAAVLTGMYLNRPRYSLDPGYNDRHANYGDRMQAGALVMAPGCGAIVAAFTLRIRREQRPSRD